MSIPSSGLKNKVQLITYADSLGRNLKELNIVLDNYFKGVVYGVHILPFYPSSSDRGFSPLTHFKVDSAFGDWEDVERIAKKYDLMCDFIPNHVSAKSDWFCDFLEKGDKSLYKDYFITAEKFSRRIKKNREIFPALTDYLERIANKLRRLDIVFHKGGVNRFVLKKIYRPRPGTPFVEFKLKDGTIRNIWCTFSADQIDLDINNPEVKNHFKKTLIFLAERGIRLVRLDAVGYAAKERGTNNFLIPETYQLIEDLTRIAHQRGIKILPEVHNHYTFQMQLARAKGVDYIYDFALPLLLMNALFTKNVKNLKHWIKIRPKKAITTLDTHDGLPVPDVEDLMPEEERKMVIKRIRENGGNDALRASGANSNNVDVYQINCTYYSALGEDDNSYIIARAVQFFVPGIPQVYYVGLLAGKNDAQRLNKTGIGRDINRHAYTIAEVAEEMKRPVVERLFWLIRFRNRYPAFNGRFYTKKTEESALVIGWKKETCYCELRVDFLTKRAIVEYREKKSGKRRRHEL
jgi:sucrose phosphorylase